MIPTRRWALRVFAVAAIAATPAWGSSARDAVQDGSIVLMRHAHAPGVGDPAHINLDDSGTQRNLDEVGRSQARRLGEQFRQRKVAVAAVVTSQWCRARETAEFAFPGLGHVDTSFNSFFAEPASEAMQTSRARATLQRWRGPGVLVVVTHQVNITALTGLVPAVGEAVVVRPGPQGLAVSGKLAP